MVRAVCSCLDTTPVSGFTIGGTTVTKLTSILNL